MNIDIYHWPEALNDRLIYIFPYREGERKKNARREKIGKISELENSLMTAHKKVKEHLYFIDVSIL